ncbi:MAG: helix-turn-helix domain-containing protein [Phycisphaerales bacterium]
MAANPGFVKEIVTQDRISLSKLAKELSLDVSTLYRWTLRGVLARNGDRVRLKVFKLAGRTYVRRDDLESFMDAVNQQSTTGATQTPTPTKSSVHSHLRARSELEQAGIQVDRTLTDI